MNPTFMIVLYLALAIFNGTTSIFCFVEQGDLWFIYGPINAMGAWAWCYCARMVQQEREEGRRLAQLIESRGRSTTTVYF